MPDTLQTTTPEQAQSHEFFPDDPMGQLAWDVVQSLDYFTEAEKSAGLNVSTAVSLGTIEPDHYHFISGAYYFEVNDLSIEVDPRYYGGLPDDYDYTVGSDVERLWPGEGAKSLYGLTPSFAGIVDAYNPGENNRVFFSVRILSSATGFNDAMRKLGRTPGVDVFGLVDTKSGIIPDDEYIDNLAEGRVPVTESDPGLLIHDRDPRDHIQSWWSMPVEIFDIAKSRAQDLKEQEKTKKTGRLVNLVAKVKGIGGKPQGSEIATFVSGVDEWSNFTWGLVLDINSTLSALITENSGPEKIAEMVMASKHIYPKRFSDILENIGVEPKHGLTSEDFSRLTLATIFETVVKSRVLVSEMDDEDYKKARRLEVTDEADNKSLLEAVEIVNKWARDQVVLHDEAA